MICRIFYTRNLANRWHYPPLYPRKTPFCSTYLALSPCESVLFLYFLSTHLSTQVSTQPHFQIKTGLESAGYQMGFKGW